MKFRFAKTENPLDKNGKSIQHKWKNRSVEIEIALC
jgi:hypothetical protein